jgi:hypothetical protein
MQREGVELQRLGRVRARGQLAYLQLYPFCSVAGLLRGLRHHRSNGLTDEADFILGQDGSPRDKGRFAIGILQHRPTGQAAELGKILRGVDGDYARCALRVFNIQAVDVSVGVGRTQNAQIKLIGKHNVISELAATGNQTRIFLARYALTYAKFQLEVTQPRRRAA